ncbi:Flp pilus assembly protein CpaB [Kineosporia rhizophila]|uniref:Flp pilus assembly protein CpaB n=1 Tax=Kineosporia TaxID=49184 RepID=UPI001E490501|nr:MULTISPECIES: Flp pilus assembly protein CpaB [Kineosporia]MCE0534328.1 Flp pilus assembly protein CpaB [Kineosporia rhizophila]GLY13876.1 Flp pilus assembly protein CpaB [Kineosporia sp. NBRC 101677]
MNPRQRRGVLLMGVAVLGAIAVFVMIAGYVTDIGRRVGPMTTSYRFTEDVEKNQPITGDQVEEVELPSKWLPEAAIQSFDTSRGLVATADIPQGAMLQEGMAAAPPELKPGQSEIAILIDAETGVAGKIQKGDLVDIYGTFSVRSTDAQGASEDQDQARVIVSNAQVLAIGALQRVDSPDAEAGDFEQNEVVPVTFALDREDSLKVTYAESFATKVRLALVAPGTRSRPPGNADVLDGDKLLKPVKAGGNGP